MTTQILNFKKTDHFLHSQWNRSINDQTLYKILPLLECTSGKKDVIIASPSFLKQKGVSKNRHESLIIISKQNILLTCYWCHNPKYLYSTEPHINFQYLK